MPFRHVMMFRWADHVDAEHVQRVRDAHDELAARVAGIRHHAHGNDVGVSEGTFDYLVVADFDSVADWRAYRDHPAHVLLVEELIAGYVVDRASGQYQLPDDHGTHDAAHGSVATPIRPDLGSVAGSTPEDESDEAMLARARRAAMAEMQRLLTEPDD